MYFFSVLYHVFLFGLTILLWDDLESFISSLYDSGYSYSIDMHDIISPSFPFLVFFLYLPWEYDCVGFTHCYCPQSLMLRPWSSQLGPCLILPALGISFGRNKPDIPCRVCLLMLLGQTRLLHVHQAPFSCLLDGRNIYSSPPL